MHAATDTRLIRCLDGLAMSFAMIEHLHSELHTTCVAISASPDMLPVAFERCWSFVDSVHRAREIAQSVPGLNTKTRKIRAFLDETSVAEDFRHYIQHLRNELMKDPGNTFPVWGSLSWVDASDSMLTHTALAGAQVGETSYPGCVFDTVERRWVSKVTLSVGGFAFNFDPIASACARFKAFILPWIQNVYSPGIKLVEKLPIVSVRIQIKTRGDA